MKISIWDILTGAILLGILCLIGGFGAILVNPGIAFNPLKPPPPVATIAIPTVTNTPLQLPSTWTPSPMPVQQTQKAQEGQPAATVTLRPSSTPLPTSTVLVLPTFTVTKTIRAAVGGGSCEVIYQDPADETTFDPSESFDTRWTIRNTSNLPWRSDAVDIKFSSGDRFHLGSDLYDLPYEVPANGMVDVLVRMRAPSTNGTYVSNWSLSGTNANCRFFLQIRVK